MAAEYRPVPPAYLRPLLFLDAAREMMLSQDWPYRTVSVVMESQPVLPPSGGSTATSREPRRAGQPWSALCLPGVAEITGPPIALVASSWSPLLATMVIDVGFADPIEVPLTVDPE